MNSYHKKALNLSLPLYAHYPLNPLDRLIISLNPDQIIETCYWVENPKNLCLVYPYYYSDGTRDFGWDWMTGPLRGSPPGDPTKFSWVLKDHIYHDTTERNIITSLRGASKTFEFPLTSKVTIQDFLFFVNREGVKDSMKLIKQEYPKRYITSLKSKKKLLFQL